jgi:hypothetical protein
MPLPQPGPPELQDIEFARISQEVPERFYNPKAAGECGQCLLSVITGGDQRGRIGSGLPQSSDIGSAHWQVVFVPQH